MKLLFIALFFFASAKVPNAMLHKTHDRKPTAFYDDSGNAIDSDDPNNPDIAWTKMMNSDGHNDEWKAVGHLYAADESQCSSAVFKIPNCPSQANLAAHLLTNGHCTTKNADTVALGEFFDTPKNQVHRSPIDKVLTSSYRNGPDIAIIQLKETYGTLEKKYGVKAFELATTPPVSNQRLTLTGFPTTDMNPENLGMYQSDCNIIARQTVIDTSQMWPESLVVNHCSIAPGNSGSSMVTDGKIYGVINSGAYFRAPNPGHEACEFDTCVYDGVNQPLRPRDNFGFDVTGIAKCYENCQLNTRLPGCPLPNQEDQIAAGLNGPHVTAWTSSLSHSVHLSSRFSKYVVKGCVGGQACSCADSGGYGPATTTTTASGITSITPADYFPGIPSEAVKGAHSKFVFLCIRGVNADGTLDDIKDVRNLPIYLYQATSTKPINAK